MQATNATLGQGTLNMPTMTSIIQPTGHQHSSTTSLSSSQASPSQAVTNSTGQPGPAAHLTHSSQLHDTVIPDVNAIRANPTISQSVYHVFSPLEASSSPEATHGKTTHKKSGRFNAADTVTAVREFRWPNEGFHGIGGCKRTLYGDLTIQEWAVAQLSYIYHI